MLLSRKDEVGKCNSAAGSTTCRTGKPRLKVQRYEMRRNITMLQDLQSRHHKAGLVTVVAGNGPRGLRSLGDEEDCEHEEQRNASPWCVKAGKDIIGSSLSEKTGLPIPHRDACSNERTLERPRRIRESPREMDEMTAVELKTIWEPQMPASLFRLHGLEKTGTAASYSVLCNPG